jgi:hypothetical protein
MRVIRQIGTTKAAYDPLAFLLEIFVSGQFEYVDLREDMDDDASSRSAYQGTVVIFPTVWSSLRPLFWPMRFGFSEHPGLE